MASACRARTAFSLSSHRSIDAIRCGPDPAQTIDRRSRPGRSAVPAPAIEGWVCCEIASILCGR